MQKYLVVTFITFIFYHNYLKYFLDEFEINVIFIIYLTLGCITQQHTISVEHVNFATF